MKKKIERKEKMATTNHKDREISPHSWGQRKGEL
jgi:hypothetical protein